MFFSSEEEVGVASDSDESEGDDAEPVSSDEGQRLITETKPTLRLSGGFRWDVGVVSDTKGVAENSSDSEMEVEEVSLASPNSHHMLTLWLYCGPELNMILYLCHMLLLMLLWQYPGS